MWNDATRIQITKLEKSIANGTGTDRYLCFTFFYKSVKHGGNLFTAFASLGTRLLPYAKSIVAPALATGAV